MAGRSLRPAGLQRVLFDGLFQQAVPGFGRLPRNPFGHRRRFNDALVPQPADEGAGFTQPPETGDFLVAHLRRDTLRHAERLHRREKFPLPRDDCAARPVPLWRPFGKAHQFRHDGLGLHGRVAAGRQDSHLAARNRIELFPRPARRVFLARPVDMDRAVGLHPFPRRRDDRVGRRNNVAGRAVIGGEVGGLRAVVRFEPADEFDRRALEGVNVLVVVADREQGELAGLVLDGPPGQRGNQGIFLFADILVFVDKDPAEAGEQPFPLFVRLLRRQALAAQQTGCAVQDVPEQLVVRPLRPPGEARTGQPHGEAVAGQHGHTAGVVADQFLEAAADIDRGVAVVGQREDAVRVFPPDADQIGDAVHQHPRLAGAGAGEDQHVGLFPVVGDDTLLVWIPQAFDDGTPGVGCGLAADLLVPARQPAGEERLLIQAEIVLCKAHCVPHTGESALGKRRHDVNLQHLALVVKVERPEVRFCEAAFLLLPAQPDRHGWAEHRQPFVQADNLHFVQP